MVRKNTLYDMCNILWVSMMNGFHVYTSSIPERQEVPKNEGGERRRAISVNPKDHWRIRVFAPLSAICEPSGQLVIAILEYICKTVT